MKSYREKLIRSPIPYWTNQEEENGTVLGCMLRRNDDSIAKQHCSVHHKATEEEGNQRTLGKETWRKKCGQQVQVRLKEARDGNTIQSWMETSGLWTAPLGVTTLMSSQVNYDGIF